MGWYIQKIARHIISYICSCLLELRVSLRRTGLRQRVDHRMLVQVHAALFTNVRLLAVSERSISATLTVVVTHPGTNAHNCYLTSKVDLTAI